LKRFLRNSKGVLPTIIKTEMDLHKKVTDQTRMPVYFADLGCPGQRGINENTNKLIRVFYPKKTDF